MNIGECRWYIMIHCLSFLVHQILVATREPQGPWKVWNLRSCWSRCRPNAVVTEAPFRATVGKHPRHLLGRFGRWIYCEVYETTFHCESRRMVKTPNSLQNTTEYRRIIAVEPCKLPWFWNGGAEENLRATAGVWVRKFQSSNVLTEILQYVFSHWLFSTA